MNRTVLIVDDSEADRYIATRVIKRSKLFDHVYSLNDGEAAYDHFKNDHESKLEKGEYYPPSIIVLDINMPRMNGFEFLENYKKLLNQKKSNIQFVAMLTSSDHKGDVATAAANPLIKVFLKKPFTNEHAQQLAKMLDEREVPTNE